MYGQLGLGDETAAREPVYLPKLLPAGSFGGEKIASVVAGEYQTCAITVSGKLYCWGDNGNTTTNRGILGVGSDEAFVSSPTPVIGALLGKTVTYVSASVDSVCAVD